jgi:pimeloyl-ACP methyl ester carboxylesterase
LSSHREQFAVAGTTLFVESRGSGPLFLFIVGGNGDPAIYAGVAAQLEAHFHVVTYTRRGFVGSPLDGPVDSTTRVATDVEDAVALLGHFTSSPAIIFGSSSGVIVALDLALRHPDLIDIVILHEPPILDLLDNSDVWAAKFGSIHASFERDGLWPAIATFGETVGLGRPMGPSPFVRASPQEKAMLDRTQANMTFWFEHELRQYPAYLINMANVEAVAGKLVLAGGTRSRESGAMPFLPIAQLATRLHREVVEFPGGHTGYLEQPGPFAQHLESVLSARR